MENDRDVLVFIATGYAGASDIMEAIETGTGTENQVVLCHECRRQIAWGEEKIVIGDLTYCHDCYTIEGQDDGGTRTNDLNN
jgi:hypothetical protein